MYVLSCTLFSVLCTSYAVHYSPSRRLDVLAKIDSCMEEEEVEDDEGLGRVCTLGLLEDRLQTDLGLKSA